MTIINMPAIWRDFLEFYMMLFAGVATFGVVATRRQGDRNKSFVGMVIFLLAFGINHLLMLASEHTLYKSDVSKISKFERMPVLVILLITIIITIAMTMIIIGCFAKNRQHVGPAAIKESVDFLPSGIAIYSDNGNCMIVNNRMNRLCILLTGHAVLDGQELYKAALEHNMLVEMEGHSYSFQHKEIEYQGEILNELIADDVTELLEKTEELKCGNEQLEEYSKKMIAYGANIDEAVRNEEILQAKVNIHDEMNRLLLATGNAASNGVTGEELQKILRTWQNNALLLCKEADSNSKTNTIKDMETLGELIGITPVWDGSLKTDNPEILQIFTMITREAMSNAVKHAGAKHLYVQMSTAPDAYYINYNNDGDKAPVNIIAGGGLSNLRNLIESVGGEIKFFADPTFVMMIKIPKGED